MTFTPTKHHNPCPICSDISGDCRINGDLVLCHSFPDGGDVPDYEFKKPSNCGVWGVYAPAQDDWTPEQRDDFKTAQQLKTQARLAKESELHRNGLSRAERDRNIRAIAAYVGLNSKHHQQLLDRGLTPEQIKTGLYFSICPYQPVPLATSDKLAGVGFNRDGKKVLVASKSGFACVIFDNEGQAVGWQLRDENPEAENKYLWAKSAFSSHLQDGELPLTVRGDGSTVWLTEGILKPDIASCKFGLKVIGAAGGNFLSSKTQLKKYLGDSQRVIYAPDAGGVITPEVYRRDRKNIKYLVKSGYEVQVAWWKQTTKDSPDIDELDSLDGVQYLSPKDWYREAVKIQQYHQWRRFTPDIILNEQFLSGRALMQAIADHLPKISRAGLIVGIKGGLGSNKTGSTGELLNMLPRALQGMGVIQISDLNRLLLQSVERYNEIKDGRTFYHLHEDEAYELVAGEENIAACFQSLMRWLDQHLDDKIIVWDESLSGIKSFLDGDTLKRSGMQRAIAQKLREMFKRSSLILLLDGNLTDENCALVQALSGGKALVKVENKQPVPRRYHFHEWTEKELLIAAAIEAIKGSYRTAITSDNATELRKIYQQLLDLGISPEQIIISDKNSTPEECPEACLKKTTAYLEAHPKVIAFLYSPSMNRGFDIDGEAIRYGRNIFEKQFSFFDGIIGLDQIDQQLFRIRSEVTERHLWIAPTAKPNPRSYGYTKRVLESFKDASTSLDNFGSPETKTAFQDVVQRAIADFEQDAFFKYELKMREAERYENEAPPERFRSFMQAKFCTFSSATKPTEALINHSADGVERRKAIKQQWDAEKLERQKIKATLIAKAPLTLEALDQLKAKYPEEYADVSGSDVGRKIRLEKILPTFTSSEVCTPENILLIEQKPEAIPSLELFLMLNHSELAIARLEKDIHNRIEEYQKNGFVWLGDFQSDALKIKAYNDIGIPEFIQKFQDEPFTKDSPEVQEILKKAGQQRNRKRLGYKPLEDKIKAIKALVKPLGFTQTPKRKGDGYEYRVVPMLPSGLHQQIIKSLAIKNRGEIVQNPDWKKLLLRTEDITCICYEKGHNLTWHQSHTPQGLELDSMDKKNVSENPQNSKQKLTPSSAPMTTAIAETQRHKKAQKSILEPVAAVATSPKLPWEILGAVQDAIMALTTGDRKPMQQLCNRLQNASIIHQAISQLEELGAVGLNHIFISRWITA